jgi:hypothetical protein
LLRRQSAYLDWLVTREAAAAPPPLPPAPSICDIAAFPPLVAATHA